MSDRELNDWRALTVFHLCKLDDADARNEYIDVCTGPIAKGIVSVLGSLSTQAPGILEDELRNILNKAVRLSQLMRRQRACWSVRHPADLALSQSARMMLFDHVYMEDKDDDEEEMADEGSQPPKPVKIVIFPGLHKQGNADGDHFDVESCVARSLVRCGEPLRKISQRGNVHEK